MFQGQEYRPWLIGVAGTGHRIIVPVSAPIKVVALAGGIGGARFLKGLRLIENLEISVVVNNGDDITMQPFEEAQIIQITACVSAHFAYTT